MTAKLDLVRKLLAQAEGTSHEAEAATFLAKAQALMTQYGIDEAEARASGTADDDTIEREVVDIPGRTTLIKAKRSLLSVCATANNCLAMIGGDKAKTMYIQGYGHDRERTVLLFNSLLIQMERAIREQGRTDVTYRNNFAWAYLSRIQVRLDEARADAARLRGTGAEIALRDTMSEVEASVGKLRKAPQGKRRKYDPNARADGDAAGRRAVLENRLDAGARSALH